MSGAVKTVTKGARKTAKVSAKAASDVTKQAKKIASNPRRTVRQAAENVQQTASRARTMGDSVVTAGELLKETADFVDSMATRAKARTQQGPKPRRRR
ncbi:MAG: hypothetical protein JO302_00675 [Candidatus Eremiobacteraeota bacterium]|nr:hypothetical protein [Candidatus Eremiobacteraeota bacterium]